MTLAYWKQLASIDHTASACLQVHKEICSEGAGSLNREEEQGTADAFDESVEKTCTLLNHLMAMKQAQQTAANVNDDLEDVEESKNADPHKDYTVSIERITKSFEKLRTIVDKSTIHPNHQLRRDVKRLSSRINYLSTEENVIHYRPSLLPLQHQLKQGQYNCLRSLTHTSTET